MICFCFQKKKKNYPFSCVQLWPCLKFKHCPTEIKMFDFLEWVMEIWKFNFLVLVWFNFTAVLLLSTWFFVWFCYILVLVDRSFEHRFQILINTRPSLFYHVFTWFCMCIFFFFLVGERHKIWAKIPIYPFSF